MGNFDLIMDKTGHNSASVGGADSLSALLN